MRRRLEVKAVRMAVRNSPGSAPGTKLGRSEEAVASRPNEGAPHGISSGLC